MHNLLPFAGGGWSGFGDALTDFFQNGLGNDGLRGISIAVMVIGLVGALVSFVLHKFNPQLRMPGPVIMLFIALAGGIGSFGIERPINFIKDAGEWVLSLFGV